MDTVLTEIIKAVFAALAPILATYAVLAAHRLLQRLGVQLDSAWDAKIRYYATEAVRYAEEWVEARRASQKTTTGIDAAAKLQAALTYLADKLPGLSQQDALAAVHAALQEIGLGASAAQLEPATSPVPSLAGAAK